MLSEQQQRIMGYFIEEAKDHLNTIEQGLLNLQATIEDQEMVNEVFRAAHSVKGGAAMLGLNSIQQTAHRLEDYFKVLKECPLKVDQTLETLFLQVFDTLQELLEQLQGPFGLTDDKSQEVMARVEPVFAELNQHLTRLVTQSGVTPPDDVDFMSAPKPPQPVVPARVVASEDSALRLMFQSDVPVQLREMLQCFKQPDTSDTRRQLQEICRSLADLGEPLDLSAWCALLDVARRAIANPDNTYRTLAPIIIKEVKQAQELVLAGRAAEVAASPSLSNLAPADLSSPDADAEFAALLSMAELDSMGMDELSLEESSLTGSGFGSSNGQNTADLSELDLFANDVAQSPLQDEAELASDDWFSDAIQASADQSASSEQNAQEIDRFLDDDRATKGEGLALERYSPTSSPSHSTNGLSTGRPLHALDDDLDLGLAAPSSAPPSAPALDLSLIDHLSEELTFEDDGHQMGPEVGMAELNSLADLFEGEMPDLGPTWQEEEIISDSSASDNFPESLELDSSNDFSDLLQESNASPLNQMDDDDLSGLLGQPAAVDGHVVSKPIAAATTTPRLEERRLSSDRPLSALPQNTNSYDINQTNSNPLGMDLSVHTDAATDDSCAFFTTESHPDGQSASINEVEGFTATDSQGLEDLGLLFADLESEPIADEHNDRASGEVEFDSPLAVESSNPNPSELFGLDDPLAFGLTDSAALSSNGLDDEPLHSSVGSVLEASLATDDTDVDGQGGDDFDAIFGQTPDDLDSLFEEEGQILSTQSTPSEHETLLPESFEPAESAFLARGAEDLAVMEPFPDIQPTSDESSSESVAAMDGIPDVNDFWATDSVALDDPIAVTRSADPEEDDWLNSSHSEPANGATVPGFDLDPFSASDLEISNVEGFNLENSDLDSSNLDSSESNPESAFSLEESERTPDLADASFGSEALFIELEGSEPESAAGELDNWFSPGSDDVSDWNGANLSEEESFDTLFEADSQVPLAENSLELGDTDLNNTDLNINNTDLDDSGLDDSGLFDAFSEEDLGQPLGHDADSAVLSGQDALIEQDMAEFFAFGAEEEPQAIAEPDSFNDAVDWDSFDLGASDETNQTPLAAPTTIPEINSSDDVNHADLGEFTDLASMLDLESQAETDMTSASAAMEFDDLEAMLNGSASPQASANLQESANRQESSHASAHGLAARDDDFADLDALLEEDEPQSAVVETVPISAVQVDSADDDFGDLEALLQEADQTLGVGSSPANRKGSGMAPNRRPSRRGGLTDQTMRVSVKHLDNLNNLVGELVVNRNSLEQTQERLRQFLDNLLYQVQQLSDVGQRMRDLYERSLLESSLLSSRRSYHLTSSSSYGSQPNSGFPTSQPNHATGISFDALEMDRFTGFHTLSQEMIELIVRVRESASDIDFVVEESDQVTRNFRQITTQLQEGLTRARMVPFAQTADRLPRGVRDNSLKYGKQAELILEGRETLIDKMIVEQLYDPMTHLVNNAIAHGIEPAEERLASGKPATGRIILRTFHQGNQTIISVSDDGAGIDPENVKAKAVAKGLITAAEAKQMSRLDTYDLLFHHGFSTADQVDDIKGRGVGLDVVRSNLNEIRGSITIDSTIGKGTTFTIRLPLTLSISKALCCISNRARIAFPMDGVEDMLDVPKDRVQRDDQDRPCIYWRDALLPFQPLADLLKHSRMLGRGSVYGGNQEDDIISVVVLRGTGNFLALQVDQVLGEQEIVIKQLEGPVPKPIGIAGATVLGDGRIMPIADVLELIDLSQGRIRQEAGSSLWDMDEQLPPEAFVAKTDPTVLIVDDSITVRELLSMTFNKIGYRVEQARDGQEAWEKLRSGLPCDLVFCDIEMPRMDGLELLSRLQKDPSLSHLPIAMLTSRGADRHRQMAVQLGAKGYFTKPYLEEVLLDAAQRMLKGEVLMAGH